jgi:leader peptidase (prepilin peptidase)/N-methyltransferase
MEEIIIAILGLNIGSFLNVVISRLPKGESVVKPRSHCPKCGKLIKFYDNIPVLSYLLLRGKCRYCKTVISLQYPLIEIFTGFSFWLSYLYFSQSPLHTGFTIVFLCILIALAIIDYQHMILPFELTIGGTVIFLIYSFFHPEISASNAILSGFGAAIVFAGMYFFYLKVRKVEGLGQGDIWMVLFLGAFLGINKLSVAILIASISGTLVGIFFILFKGKNMKLELPFGTFLSFGAYLSAFFGNDILRMIQSLFK